MGVEEADGRVEPDGDPDAVAGPAQLPHLALLPRMRFETLLESRQKKRTVKKKLGTRRPPSKTRSTTTSRPTITVTQLNSVDVNIQANEKKFEKILEKIFE